jgi:hypothetical protein
MGSKRNYEGHTGNFSPYVPTAYYYEQAMDHNKFSAHTTYDVWFVGPDAAEATNTTNAGLTGPTGYKGEVFFKTGTKIVTGGTDPEGDTAKAIIALGLLRNSATALENPLGTTPGIREGEVTYASGRSSRKFGLLKLINGRTGKAKYIDIARSAKRFAGAKPYFVRDM